MIFFIFGANSLNLNLRNFHFLKFCIPTDATLQVRQPFLFQKSGTGFHNLLLLPISLLLCFYVFLNQSPIKLSVIYSRLCIHYSRLDETMVNCYSTNPTVIVLIVSVCIQNPYLIVCILRVRRQFFRVRSRLDCKSFK